MRLNQKLVKTLIKESVIENLNETAMLTGALAYSYVVNLLKRKEAPNYL